MSRRTRNPWLWRTDKSELGPDKHAGAVDYTGAEAKTDPEEIALVRKIDWRLMVSYSERD